MAQNKLTLVKLASVIKMSFGTKMYRCSKCNMHVTHGVVAPCLCVDQKGHHFVDIELFSKGKFYTNVLRLLSMFICHCFVVIEETGADVVTHVMYCALKWVSDSIWTFTMFRFPPDSKTK